MSEVKHTPGPWTAQKANEDGNYAIRAEQDHNNTLYCNIEVGWGPQPVEICRKNALLIAAAPELLAALEALMKAEEATKHDFTAKEIDGLEAAILMADAAIKKAKGGREA